MCPSVAYAGTPLVNAQEGVVMVGGAVTSVVLEVTRSRVQQTGFMVVVQVAVAHGEVTGAARQVDESVPVLVLWLVLAVHLTVVHPNVMGVACGNAVRTGMMNDEVADDDIALVFDVQPYAGQFGTLRADDGLVG